MTRLKVWVPAIAVLLAAVSPTMACGLRGTGIPLGTPIQELSIRGHVRPTMGFGTMQSVVVSASIVARPCHGTLTMTTPLGFRYAPAPGFTGIDMYAIRGCLGPGRCNITGAAITVRQ